MLARIAAMSPDLEQSVGHPAPMRRDRIHPLAPLGPQSAERVRYSAMSNGVPASDERISVPSGF